MKTFEEFSFVVEVQGRDGEGWVFFLDDTPESVDALENELFQLTEDGVLSSVSAMDALESIESRIEATNG